MRQLKPQDLLDKKILNKEEDLEENAIKYCRNKYNELLYKHSNNANNYWTEPVKEYEIIILDVYGGKTFLLKSCDLPEGENKELYYSFEIANKIYKNLIDIKDSIINKNNEIQDIFRLDYLKLKNEIDTYKQQDKKIFLEETKIYQLISKTPIYNEYNICQKNIKNLLKKNNELKEELKNNQTTIEDLRKKLKVALDKIQILQTPKTFFEKLKDLFKFEKKKYLIEKKENRNEFYN